MDGTFTLMGVLIGFGLGLLTDQIPLATSGALAVGAGLDYWLYDRRTA